MSTVHIESNENEIAKIVLMPGDPKRAEFIAKTYLKDYKLVNNVRGMTAYTGYFEDKLVTIFPSGMGNPSMGIYSYELFKYYNVDYIIRIGSTGSYSVYLSLNDVILVTSSYSDSNYAKTLNNYEFKEINSSNYLNNIIINTASTLNINLKQAKTYSTDAFYEQNNDFQKKLLDYNTQCVEMETFALFTNAMLLNKQASSLLTVSDSFLNDYKLTNEEREKNLKEMIVLALSSIKKL